MKKIFLFLTAVLSLNLFAIDYQDSLSLFHERMIEREPVYFHNVEISKITDIPAQVEEKRTEALDDLIDFANHLDLFSKGFSYKLNDDVYEVTTNIGDIVAYTFSMTITKNGVVTGIGFVELIRRFDGVFFQARETAWYHD